MTMEAGADTQQSGETAVSESEAQQISLAQVNFVRKNDLKSTRYTVLSQSGSGVLLLLREMCGFE